MGLGPAPGRRSVNIRRNCRMEIRIPRGPVVWKEAVVDGHVVAPAKVDWECDVAGPVSLDAVPWPAHPNMPWLCRCNPCSRHGA